jgi:hypothetical protein
MPIQVQVKFLWVYAQIINPQRLLQELIVGFEFHPFTKE